MNMSLSKLREMVKDREVWQSAVRSVTKSQSWLSKWMNVTWNHIASCLQEADTQMPLRDVSLSRDFPLAFIIFFLKIFWSESFLVLIEFVTILLLFYLWFLGCEACGKLSSPTRDWTRTPCIGRWSPNHWTTGEVFLGFKKCLSRWHRGCSWQHSGPTMHLCSNNDVKNKKWLLLWPFILPCNSKLLCYISSEHGHAHNLSLINIFYQGLQTLSKSYLGIWMLFKNSFGVGHTLNNILIYLATLYLPLLLSDRMPSG